MRQVSKLAGAAAIVVLSAATAFAAPCTTGTAGQKAANDKSSNVEPGSTAKVTPGAKAESPGTVGAMNNVGSNATSASDVSRQTEGKPTAAQEGAGC